MKTKGRKALIYVLALITIEQVIKIIINNNFLDKSFSILPPILYFEPMFNRDYSWFNSMLQLGAGRWLHIGVVAVMTILIYLFYKYLNKQSETSKIIDAMFIFVFSGAVCSLMDKVIWDGSLDYIKVNGFFTFDLKDVYINVFNGLFLLSLFLSSRIYKEYENRDILRGFARYILGKSQ